MRRDESEFEVLLCEIMPAEDFSSTGFFSVNSHVFRNIF